MRTEVIQKQPSSREIRKEKLRGKEDLIHTAGHELNHALVAFAYGVPVLFVSVEKEGPVLGKTVLGGSFHSESYKVIFAAGAATTHDGTAHGFGHDMSVVDMIHYCEGGDSRMGAKSKAEAALAGYSRDVRERAAEIIADRLRVSGPEIPDIMRAAEQEIQEEKGVEKPHPILNFENESQKTKDKPEKTVFTILEYQTDTTIRISEFKLVDSKPIVQKEDIFCSNCKLTNIHTVNCLVNRDSYDNKMSAKIANTMVKSRMPVSHS